MQSLKDRAVVSGCGHEIDMEAVARAEKALEELPVEFDGWLREEVDRLLAARDQARRDGLTEENFGELFRASHDLRGEGDTFGYPLIGEICGLLCELLESTADKSNIPTTLIDNHVDAIQIIMRDGIKDPAHQTSRAVVERLGEVVADLTEHFTRTNAA